MTLDKHAAREAWFRGFDAWQAKFNTMLQKCAGTPAKAKTFGKEFLQDTMIPFMDAAKDRLLVAVAKDIQAACDAATRLDRLVNKENE
ncbi:MAG TPA: hypothetical protein VKM55_14305 [Candidatus Lokiarchaeia archaeon]|nr:hypothetical protein [Candidatus Lokiarchaeia archaeon]